MRETKIKINQIDYDFGEGGSGAKTITLLSVTTAPEPPFSIESRYYNSADNLIYKAVDDNTWEDAETFEPTLGTFYIYQGQSYLYDAKTQSLFQIGEYTPEANLVTKNIILSTNTNTAPLNVDLTNAVIFGVYLNGLYQLTTEHYSISSSAITFTSVYPAGTSITIVYSNSLTLSVHGQSGGGGNVDDVQLDGQSVLNNRIANINVGGGDNIWSYSADCTIYNDFAGYGYQVLNFIVGEDIQIEDNHQLNFDFWVRISTGTLIFRNGQLLELMEDYDIPNNTSLYIHDTLANNDKISIINGLSKLTTITGIIGNTIHCNYYINENTLIFKNGLLLSDEDYHTNNGNIIFEQNLVSSDKITLIKCVTNTFHNTEVSGSTFSYEGPFNNLVFKNGQLLISDIDYEIESMDEESHVTLRFFEVLDNDIISMIYNEPYSLYALFGDKQNSLPLYENGKVLSTDGHQLKWITQDYNDLINKPTIPQGTVTSVQVQAGTGLTSSQNTAQTTTLNTTIGIDSNYKLPTTTEWNGKQDTISDLNYIRNKVALVDDKISGVDITNSGNSLPATTSYSVGDTFLNTTNKKIYKTEMTIEGYELNTNVIKDDIILDLQTGIASGFKPSGQGHTMPQGIRRSSLNILWKEPVTLNFHFEITETRTNQVIANLYQGGGNYKDVIFYIGNDNKLYCTYTQGSYGPSTQSDIFLLANYQLSLNTEYFVKINKNGTNVTTTISMQGYDVSSEYEETINNVADWYPSENYSNLIYGYYNSGSLNGGHSIFSGSIYLADSTGDFLIPEGTLTWDSGTTLEDNTQYNDTTNEKTYYYNNNILYLPVDSLPSQSGQSGKFLTTDGTNLSWGTPQGGGGSVSLQQYDYEEQVYADGGMIASFVNINLNTYLSQITDDHAVTKFSYDGTDWYIGDSNPSVVDLTDYGISISDYTPVANDEFYVYSFCLRNRTDFTFMYSGDTVHCVFLNGMLILKSDYYLTDKTENGQTYKKINFNNYTLRASDKLSTL